MLREILGRKEKEVEIKKMKKIRSGMTPLFVLHARYYYTDRIKEDEMAGACIISEKCKQKGGNYLGDVRTI